MTKKYQEPQIHRVYLDPALAPFGEQYVAHLQHLHRRGVRWLNKTMVTSSYTALLRITQNHLKVVLFGGGEGYFEFATSGWPIVTHTSAQGSDGYSGIIVGVRCLTQGAGLQFKPQIVGQQRSADDGITESAVGRQFQVDLVNEPVAYLPPVNVGTTATPHYKWPNLLYEAWAPGHAHTGVPYRATDIATGIPERYYAGMALPRRGRDVKFDVPFEIGKGRAKNRRAYIRSAADWPRACGVATITDSANGTREFAIYVDAFSQFYVFPTAAIGPLDGINQNVDSSMVQVVTPTFPTWAYKAGTKFIDYFTAFDATTLGQSLVDLPEIDWKCRGDGLQALAVVYTRAPYTYDSLFWEDADASPITPMTAAIFAEFVSRAGVQTRDDTDFMPGYNESRYMTAPGILRVDLDIVLTGPNLPDFGVFINTVTVRDPTSHDRCPLFVGYVGQDIAGMAVKNTPVALDVEKWSLKTGALNTWSSPHGNNFALLSLRNLNTNAEIKAFPARAVLAVDMQTLSFAFMAYPDSSLATLGGNIIDYFGVAIFHNAAYKEVLYPESPYPPAVKTSMETLASSNPRTTLDGYIAADPRWLYLPLNYAADGWAMAGMTDYRDYFAQGHNYFAFYHTTGDHRFYVSSIDMTVTDVYKTGPAVAVDVRSQEEDVRGRWAQYPGLGTGVGHLMFCTAPKWGWNTYQSLVADHVWCSPFTTFWTHPNGSYAFWDNSWVFNAQGFVRDLDVFDVAKLEHVVFDRLKLMITTNSGRALGSTTFRDLYNQAVTAGLDAGTLASDITLITYDQLRATFEKQVFLNSTGTPPTTLLLDLKATWDSHIYFYPEPGICSPHSPIPNTPVVHGLLGLNFGMDWRTGGGYTATINPVSANKHVRFANPLLIE